MIDSERLRQTFLDLLSLNSPPGEEHAVRWYCAEALRDAGFVCQQDAIGNLIAQKSGTVSEARRIFFSAHLDTVQPTEDLVVREEVDADGDVMFRATCSAVLGADDKAGLAEILEAVRVLEDQGIPHGDLQVIFSVGEEVGMIGAKALSMPVIAGSIGFVLDASGSAGTIITAAPAHDVMEARITGRAAHAGFCPEKGISALQIACRAVDRMRLGRIDSETTSNVGIIQGGVANNVVAEAAVVHLEARSRNPEKLDRQVAHMRECFEEAARHYGGSYEFRHEREYGEYQWSMEDLPVRLAADAWRKLGRGEPGYRMTGGGSDANVFNSRGVPAVLLTCGYVDAHSVHEQIALSEMVRAAEWVVAIVETAAEVTRS